VSRISERGGLEHTSLTKGYMTEPTIGSASCIHNIMNSCSFGSGVGCSGCSFTSVTWLARLVRITGVSTPSASVPPVLESSSHGISYVEWLVKGENLYTGRLTGVLLLLPPDDITKLATERKEVVGRYNSSEQ
jgi:hypothetical protein